MIGQLIVGLGISGAVALARRARARREAAWRRMIADLAYRLRAPLTEGPSGPQLSWQAGRWPAQLSMLRLGDAVIPVVTLGPDDRLRHPFTLTLRRDPRGEVDAAPRPLTGDRDFDQLVHAEGDALAARAACGTQTRRALLRIFQPATDEDFLNLREGALSVSLVGPDPTDTEAVDRRLSRVLFLARALTVDGRSLPDRLLTRLDAEPRADQRRLLLQELLAEAPADPDVQRALHTALDDPSPAVRLDAIRCLQTEPAWHAAAALVRDPLMSTGHRRAALALLDQGPQAFARPAWHAVLSEPPGPLHAELIARVEAAGDWTARPRLRALLGLANDSVAVAACGALRALGPGDPADALALVQQLADPSPAVHRAVCQALVTLGDRRSLDALRAPPAHRAHAATQRAAAHALGARLGLGGLTVTTGAPAGRLSVVDREGGLSPVSAPPPPVDPPD